MFSKRIRVVWFGIHFFLITAVCFAGVFSLIAEGATMLPSALEPYARKAEVAAAWLLGKEAAASSPVRRGIATYLHAAGIQAGYTFFAPNVPGYDKLTLELFYEDGRVEHESPHLRSKAAALRLDSSTISGLYSMPSALAPRFAAVITVRPSPDPRSMT